jgi:hypothetical protein
MAVPSDTGPRQFAVKLSTPRGDWVRRATNDDGAREVGLFLAGLPELLPPEIEWPALAARRDGKDSWHLIMADLESDESARLTSMDGDPLPVDVSTQYLAHLAGLHRAFFDRRQSFPEVGFCAVESWLTLFGPSTIEREGDDCDPFFLRLAKGWDTFSRLAPERVARAVTSLLLDPTPLVEALGHGPSTLLHGDYTLDNLGWRVDTSSTTIALNWSQAMWGPPLLDLAWFLITSSTRLPFAREQAIEVYRTHLDEQLVEDWRRSLDLALLAAMLRFGWDLALDAINDDAFVAEQGKIDLAWWLTAARRALAHLAIEVS